ncbi:hypothetical protein [Ponticoccus alexandrii]|uniref:ANTAR domain-containing protein n=1 Tax=Ponticoccus alexandrii TaxID=1943633 RepID=A0ABX7F712_9RHOB|nr:hypothetical protein [Ponticoccus alexandrii]QRF66163.1 hypothetical protein GQA70_07520 [Ponticoccus alexandrii]
MPSVRPNAQACWRRSDGPGPSGSTGGGKAEDSIAADLVLEEAHLACITRTGMSGAEIAERLVLAMIKEGATSCTRVLRTRREAATS